MTARFFWNRRNTRSQIAPTARPTIQCFFVPNWRIADRRRNILRDNDQECPASRATEAPSARWKRLRAGSARGPFVREDPMGRADSTPATQLFVLKSTAPTGVRNTPFDLEQAHR